MVCELLTTVCELLTAVCELLTTVCELLTFCARLESTSPLSPISTSSSFSHGPRIHEAVATHDRTPKLQVPRIAA